MTREALLQKATKWLYEGEGRNHSVSPDPRDPEMLADFCLSELAADSAGKECTIIAEIVGAQYSSRPLSLHVRDILERANREAQLAADLRMEQDKVIERCAQAIDRLAESTYGDFEGLAAKLAFAKAAEALRAHVDGISGEDWGELTRALAAKEEEIERLRNHLVNISVMVRAAKSANYKLTDVERNVLSETNCALQREGPEGGK